MKSIWNQSTNLQRIHEPRLHSSALELESVLELTELLVGAAQNKWVNIVLAESLDPRNGPVDPK